MQALRELTAEDEQWCDIFVGSLNPAQVELRNCYSFGQRNKYRNIFRQTAGHDRVGSNFFDRRQTLERFEFSQQMVARKPGALDHLLDLADSRWDDRQSVGPSTQIKQLVGSTPGVAIANHLDPMAREVAGQWRLREQARLAEALFQRIIDPFTRGPLRGWKHEPEGITTGISHRASENPDIEPST